MPIENNDTKTQGAASVGSKDGLGCLVHILKENFTSKKPCCVSDEPDAHTVWLKIGNQSFRLDGYFETADEAEWMRTMLAKALMNFNLDVNKFKQPNR